MLQIFIPMSYYKTKQICQLLQAVGLIRSAALTSAAAVNLDRSPNAFSCTCIQQLAGICKKCVADLHASSIYHKILLLAALDLK
jgi:hypothetical protein